MHNRKCIGKAAFLLQHFYNNAHFNKKKSLLTYEAASDELIRFRVQVEAWMRESAGESVIHLSGFCGVVKVTLCLNEIHYHLTANFFMLSSIESVNKIEF